MAQNNKLKRRAQAFMAAHEGVTYLNALKAVDEPLHELRDLLLSSKSISRYTHFFRLVAEQGNYRPVTTADGDSDRDLIAKLGLSEYLSMWSFIDDVADRRKLLKSYDLQNIWEYRALRRSGVLGSEDDAPAMEPIFHHYAYNLSDPFAPMFGTEHLGIFPVNVSSMTEIREIQDFIPVTLGQLHTLTTGEGSLGEIIGISYDEADIQNPRLWTDRYDILALSKNRTTTYNVRVFSILFKGSIEEFHAEMRAKGLEPLDFTFEDVSGSQIDFRQFESNLYARQGDKSLFELYSTQNNLLWGSPSPAKPTVLEAAESIGLSFERNEDGSFILDSEGKISTACPFHEDTDSFILQPDQGERGSFMCYSCGRNGGPEGLKLNWENPNILDEVAAKLGRG